MFSRDFEVNTPGNWDRVLWYVYISFYGSPLVSCLYLNIWIAPILHKFKTVLSLFREQFKDLLSDLCGLPGRNYHYYLIGIWLLMRQIHYCSDFSIRLGVIYWGQSSFRLWEYPSVVLRRTFLLVVNNSLMICTFLRLFIPGILFYMRYIF